MLLAGCTGELSALDPAGPRAANLATLWWAMFFGSIALFALVLTLLALTYLRRDWVSRLTPRQWIIGGGLIMPVPILIGLLVVALLLGEQLLPKRSDSPVMRVEARASQWEWRFAYPGAAGGAEADILHLPAGEPVDILVTSDDVIHSFWVPRLGGKIDAIPGKTNIVRLQADKPGRYRGICAEYCGQGHDNMGFAIEVHDTLSFAAVLGGQR